MLCTVGDELSYTFTSFATLLLLSPVFGCTCSCLLVGPPSPLPQMGNILNLGNGDGELSEAVDDGTPEQLQASDPAQMDSGASQSLPSEDLITASKKKKKKKKSTQPNRQSSEVTTGHLPNEPAYHVTECALTSVSKENEPLSDVENGSVASLSASSLESGHPFLPISHSDESSGQTGSVRQKAATFRPQNVIPREDVVVLERVRRMNIGSACSLELCILSFMYSTYLFVVVEYV